MSTTPAFAVGDAVTSTAYSYLVGHVGRVVAIDSPPGRLGVHFPTVPAADRLGAFRPYVNERGDTWVLYPREVRKVEEPRPFAVGDKVTTTDHRAILSGKVGTVVNVDATRAGATRLHVHFEDVRGYGSAPDTKSPGDTWYLYPHGTPCNVQHATEAPTPPTPPVPAARVPYAERGRYAGGQTPKVGDVVTLDGTTARGDLKPGVRYLVREVRGMLVGVREESGRVLHGGWFASRFRPAPTTYAPKTGDRVRVAEVYGTYEALGRTGTVRFAGRTGSAVVRLDAPLPDGRTEIRVPKVEPLPTARQTLPPAVLHRVAPPLRTASEPIVSRRSGAPAPKRLATVPEARLAALGTYTVNVEPKVDPVAFAEAVSEMLRGFGEALVEHAKKAAA
ncbi:hypothetical protein [Cellulosimicrobium sp. TH-20]|uniref:hypothetical protein n=1 Tax=Cellulosimicrobium sp. TH-20 TaxID=1980001 RepID=UPI0011AB13A8|nr:hypothetical protein [Cellulosimicrobium sp. TH-20]